MKTKLKVLLAAAFALTMALSNSGQRPGSEPQVNLDVVIDDTASQGMFGFGSDGGGTYIHGSQGVTASFATTGILHFKTGNRTATAYYSAPVSPVGELLTGSLTASTTFMTFVKSGLYLQTMAVGSSRCEGLIGSMPISADYTRHVGYRAGRGTLTDLNYMLVTRTNNDTWVMDSNSEPTCSSSGYNGIARINDAKNKGKANDIFHGTYYMPLRLVLTRH